MVVRILECGREAAALTKAGAGAPAPQGRPADKQTHPNFFA